jgi:hypothetical protein
MMLSFLTVLKSSKFQLLPLEFHFILFLFLFALVLVRNLISIAQVLLFLILCKRLCYSGVQKDELFMLFF